MVLRVVHKMAAQSADDGIAKQKGKNTKKRERVCVSAAVPWIFSRTLSSSASSRCSCCYCLWFWQASSLSLSSVFLVVFFSFVVVFFFFFLLLFALSGWMCRKVGGGLCRPWIYRSIHLSTASLFFVFFLLFCCTQWKLTREIRNYGERTTWKTTTTETASLLFLFFCTVSFSFSLSAWNAEKMRRHTLSLPVGFANYEQRTESEKARGKHKNKNRKFFPWLQPCRVRADRKREDLARSMAQFVLSFLFPFGFSDDRREKHRPRQRRMPCRRSSSAVAITQISFFVYRLNTRRSDVQSKMSMPGTREIF